MIAMLISVWRVEPYAGGWCLSSSVWRSYERVARDGTVQRTRDESGETACFRAGDGLIGGRSYTAEASATFGSVPPR